ncbi:MAG: hypothetical protein L0220_22865 [Acidobacteria bacterium]|nr:hypothetical protein [Acidobacteriota bacterium]
MKSFLVGIKNVVLWSYERGSWQYDVLCLLIIGTIFLAPSSFFGDRDRPAQSQAKISARMSSKPGEKFREISNLELNLFLKSQRREELVEKEREALILYLNHELKRGVTIVRFERFSNDHDQPGYRVWFH